MFLKDAPMNVTRMENVFLKEFGNVFAILVGKAVNVNKPLNKTVQTRSTMMVVSIQD